jgi:chromosome segregation ATPase
LQIDSLQEKLSNVESNLEKELDELTQRIKRCEEGGAENSKEIKLLNKRFSTELSKISSKPEEKIPYVSAANQYIPGRTQELQDLKDEVKKVHASQSVKHLSDRKLNKLVRWIYRIHWTI